MEGEWIVVWLLLVFLWLVDFMYYDCVVLLIIVVVEEILLLIKDEIDLVV